MTDVMVLLCAERVLKTYWWLDVNSDIEEHVPQCENCIKTAKVVDQQWKDGSLPEGLWVE
jgi:hypothetical protein